MLVCHAQSCAAKISSSGSFLSCSRFFVTFLLLITLLKHLYSTVLTGVSCREGRFCCMALRRAELKSACLKGHLVLVRAGLFLASDQSAPPLHAVSERRAGVAGNRRAALNGLVAKFPGSCCWLQQRGEHCQVGFPASSRGLNLMTSTPPPGSKILPP